MTEPWEDALHRLAAYFDPANPLGHYRDPQHTADLDTLRTAIEGLTATVRLYQTGELSIGIPRSERWQQEFDAWSQRQDAIDAAEGYGIDALCTTIEAAPDPEEVALLRAVAEAAKAHINNAFLSSDENGNAIVVDTFAAIAAERAHFGCAEHESKTCPYIAAILTENKAALAADDRLVAALVKAAEGLLPCSAKPNVDADYCYRCSLSKPREHFDGDPPCAVLRTALDAMRPTPSVTCPTCGGFKWVFAPTSSGKAACPTCHGEGSVTP